MMQSLLEACKSPSKKGLKLIQHLVNRQVEYAVRHLPKLPPGFGKIFITWPNLISLTRIPIVETLAVCHNGPWYVPILLLLLDRKSVV
jgi:hypothetical protein